MGFKRFDGRQWYGVVGPGNMPAAIVAKLNRELNKVLDSPEFNQERTSEAMKLMPMTPTQFTNYIKEDIARWVKVAKERHIEIE